MKLPAHLVGLVLRQERGGAYICFHGRQLALCAKCAPKAEAAALQARREAQYDEQC